MLQFDECFPAAVSWSIIGIPKHLSTSCTKERVIFIPLISFPKENTVCLSIEDNCDIFIYPCYNLTSFFPAVSWPIIGIPKHLSNVLPTWAAGAWPKERVIFIPLIDTFEFE